MGLTGFEQIDLFEVKKVFLDLDDTLYLYEPCHQSAESEVAYLALKNFGTPKTLFSEILTQAKKEVKEQLGQTASSHSRLLYFSRWLELHTGSSRLGDALIWEDIYWTTFINNMSLHSNAAAFLQECNDKGIEIALLTDLTLRIQIQKLMKLGIQNAFKFVISSEEAGADKPSLKMAQLALRKTGWNTDGLIWVGDSPKKDGLAALELGIPFFLINLWAENLKDFQ